MNAATLAAELSELRETEASIQFVSHELKVGMTVVNEEGNVIRREFEERFQWCQSIKILSIGWTNETNVL